MIENAHQYRVTRAQKMKMERSLAAFRRIPQEEREKDPKMYDLQERALKSIVDELAMEMIEYEKLVSGKLKAPDLDIVETLPTKLISARLALNWTQKDLADRLKMKHQQIQRYEATDYQTASLRTVCSIAKVLMDASQDKSQRKL